MIRALRPEEYPELLKEIPQPPKQLRLEGKLPIEGNKLLAIVGSRKYSAYARETCEAIIAGLAGSPVTIVSGLALGIDSIAHRAAMRAELQTIALPGSGIDRKVIHPRSHAGLADEIVASGGGLLSEYDDLMPAGVWAFPRRNRIMAGMCHATIVVEAEKKSGTLITSRLATEYNREVGAVPGPIHSSTSEGPHMLIRLGAALIRDHNDVLELLGLKRRDEHPTLADVEDLTNEEKIFIKLLEKPSPRDELIRKSKLDTGMASAILSLLEIKGLIAEELGEVRKTF
ncbi:MAG: protecting protein DprA protein [Parcubacteria group bacterium GW2011_GWB1_49_7]|uniref:DNA protecting protein DprA n=1 Tax=Candidatus Zambryskibacteria bacterium RIFCSPHIGHO2_01_FULL_46_25 TaxID=1802738 RepID=A0A1G2SZT6_9BACT|nr:MAG: protecting protein DprA protein [Parcubacteria group bacterium GW2011_GWA1_47_10]KKW10020.1 MAG: protecting protein DprA protein [Parcubacteria group bacterium GW2011_GWB1_49_7]OHA90372.1 MAG: DNA protecting protein DprA [Candidatus Zambryskibacteria bacterium RIFCSPHIGHO2_01_FULL_46_25]OHB00915.1 MAG: DNA protecting protein DprA [Candidatus Zambryskibacteria bacterium RIFCSPHIGHO2_12_FULL_48_10]OHB06909.1 MAG: DNA protecting protein DprA [Candidatus Zambryskibacteria bacterium RIFCSPLO